MIWTQKSWHKKYGLLLEECRQKAHFIRVWGFTYSAWERQFEELFTEECVALGFLGVG